MSNRLEAFFTVKVTKTSYSFKKISLCPYITDNIYQIDINKVAKPICEYTKKMSNLAKLVRVDIR